MKWVGLAAFLAGLRAVLADPAYRPRGKLILGFRKEWLAELEAHKHKYAKKSRRDWIEPVTKRVQVGTDKKGKKFRFNLDTKGYEKGTYLLTVTSNVFAPQSIEIKFK